MDKQKLILGVYKSVIIGIFIIIGAIIISRNLQPKYEFITRGDEFFICNTKTGDCYNKFDEASSGPREWEKIRNPFNK
jgi:hypothetical protein